MGDRSARPIEVYVSDDAVHIRVDAPGERAVSAPIPDVVAHLTEVAKAAGYDVDDTVQGELVINWPA